MSEEASEQMRVGSGKRKWVPMDHSKSKKHESKGEQTDDLSTGFTPTGNVDGSIAFIVSCDKASSFKQIDCTPTLARICVCV